MEPTPQMSELIELLEKAEGLLETALVHRIAFHPSTSDRSFRLGATDITRVTILPALMKRLHATARGVGVELQDISDETPRLLHAGRLDVAVGYMPATGSGFCQQRLFKDRFVCAVRTNHSRIEHSVSLEQFESEPQVVLTMPGSGIEVVEKALEANRIRPQGAFAPAGVFRNIKHDHRRRLLSHCSGTTGEADRQRRADQASAPSFRSPALLCDATLARALYARSGQQVASLRHCGTVPGKRSVLRRYGPGRCRRISGEQSLGGQNHQE